MYLPSWLAKYLNARNKSLSTPSLQPGRFRSSIEPLMDHLISIQWLPNQSYHFLRETASIQCRLDGLSHDSLLFRTRRLLLARPISPPNPHFLILFTLFICLFDYLFVFFQLFYCDIFGCGVEETKMIALDLTVMEMEIEYWDIKY